MENVSIIIPVLNQPALTRNCIESIFRCLQYGDGVDIEVIVVDNGSAKATARYLDDLKSPTLGVRVIRNAQNRGFAAAVNQGLAVASGDYIVLLNNDAVVTPNWLRWLIDDLNDHARIGIIGPLTNYANGPQFAGADHYTSQAGLELWSDYTHRVHLETQRRVEIVPKIIGFCMMMRRQLYAAIGPLDEQFGLGNFEDDDYCVRARIAGFDVAVALDVWVHHEGSKTFNDLMDSARFAHLMDVNRAKFLAKWPNLRATYTPLASPADRVHTLRSASAQITT